MGYENHWQVMNAKDYGIPQNRERVFMVSILNGRSFEFPEKHETNSKVINPLKGKTDKGWHFEQNVYPENSLCRSVKAGGGSGNIPKVMIGFEFPDKEPLELRLKDMLEDQVDDKYYLKPEQYANLTQNIKDKQISNAIRCGGRGSVDRHSWDLVGMNCNPSGKGMNGQIHTGQLAPTLTTNKGEGPKVAIAYAQRGRNPENPNSRESGLPTEQRLESNGSEISNCLTTVQKDSLVGLAEVKVIGGVGEKTFGKQYRQGNRIYSSKNISPNLMAQPVGNAGGNSPLVLNDLKIRKLTPLECFRLMGVDDEDFFKVRKALNETFYKGKDRSGSQLYKLAGNSIVAECIEKISLNLFNPTPGKKTGKLVQLTLDWI